MKIVYFYPHLKSPGGIEKVLSQKATYLADVMGHEVTVITYANYEGDSFFPISPKVTLVHFDIDDPYRKNLQDFSVLKRRRLINKFLDEYKRRVEAYLYEESPDICITLLYGKEYLFLSSIQDRSIKIIEYHFSTVKLRNAIEQSIKWYRPRTTNLKKLINQYDCFIALSASDLEQVGRYVKRARFIHNPIIIPETKSSLHHKSAIAVGRLSYEKGFDILLDCWNRVHSHHPEWTLKIYGEGEERDNLTNQISRLGLSHSVFLMGNTSDLRQAYIDASIFVLSSRTEGLPIALMEAMSFGLPCIATDCTPAIGELITNGHNGFITRMDAVDLSSSLLELMQNQKTTKQMGDASEIKIQPFALPRIMNQWTELFSELST